MDNLKYIKKYADKVLNGTKIYEIRKAEKGYTTGTYNIASVETKETEVGYSHFDTIETPKKVYGTAHYKLIGTNNDIFKDTDGCYIWLYDDGYHKLDEATYNFCKKNYIDKKIDYVVLEISNVFKNG